MNEYDLKTIAQLVAPLVVLILGGLFSLMTMVFSFKSTDTETKSGYAVGAGIIFVITLVATGLMLFGVK